VDRRHAADRGHDGNGRLAAASDHVDVRRIQVGVAVDARDHVGSDGGRREVDHAHTVLPQQRVVVRVGTGAGGIEDDADVGEPRHAEQPFDAVRGDRHAEAFGAGQALRGGVDPDHRAHLQRRPVAQHLDHQVGADIPGTDDGNLHRIHLTVLLPCRARTMR
jgi:hypothetical protein